jgi:DNA-directed RNA polymerase subunit RPC12/RpoP
MVDVKISCKACGKKGSMDNMKYDPENRKLLICPECFNSKAAKLEKGSKVKRALQGMQDEPEVKREAGKPQTVRERMESNMGAKDIISDKVDYRCLNCKYEFSRAKAFPLSVCPYCGKPGLEKKKLVHHDWVAHMEP